jgi:hypothetical protein
MVGIGLGKVRVRDKFMARDSQHGSQNFRVLYTPALYLLHDHRLAVLKGGIYFLCGGCICVKCPCGFKNRGLAGSEGEGNKENSTEEPGSIRWRFHPIPLFFKSRMVLD